MSGFQRRRLLGRAAAALACATVLPAHTPYRQWVVFRQRHLLLGCHREDRDAYPRAKAMEATLARALPEAHARVARAPDAARLASLFATHQLDLGLLRPFEAEAMRAGVAPFAPYGSVPLRALFGAGEHVLYVAPGFEPGHVALLLDALADGGPAIEFRPPPPAAGPPHAEAVRWFRHEREAPG